MKDITITSLDKITAFHVTNGNYLFTLDELQNCSIAQSLEKTDITGKQGRKISTLKRNKAVTISGANGLVSGGLLEMQTGSDFANKETQVMWTDYLTVGADHTAETTYAAAGTSGAEIIGLYKQNSDGTLGDELTQKASSPAATEFTYSSKTITFNTAVTEGTKVVVFYKRTVTADVLANKSDNYTQKCTLYVDATGEDKCGYIYRVQFYIPKADFNGEFTFEMGDNQTIHNFEADALAGGCFGNDSFWTYTIFGTGEQNS